MSLHVTSPEVSRLVCLSSSISHRMSSVGSCLSSLFTTLDCSSPRCDARGAAVQAERQRGSRRQPGHVSRNGGCGGHYDACRLGSSSTEQSATHRGNTRSRRRSSSTLFSGWSGSRRFVLRQMQKWEGLEQRFVQRTTIFCVYAAYATCAR